MDILIQLIFVLGGIGAGAFIGADFGRSFGIAAAVVGGFLGAATGFGLALLHRRLVLQIVRPSQLETDTKMTRIEELIYGPIRAFVWANGLMYSWLGTLLFVAWFLPREPKPGELSLGECLLMSSSLAVCGYLLLWGAQRMAEWIESRYKLPRP